MRLREHIGRVPETQTAFLQSQYRQLASWDGIALTHYFRSELNKDWPIVAFSVSRLASDKERVLEAGADHYLPKPYGYMEMMLSLGELITEVGKGRSLRALNFEE